MPLRRVKHTPVPNLRIGVEVDEELEAGGVSREFLGVGSKHFGFDLIFGSRS